MTRPPILVLSLVPALSIAGPAYAACPQDFASVGRLEASGSAGKPANVHVEQPMPDLYAATGPFKVDLAYHQRILPEISRGLPSDLTPAQVPAGFHISPNGEGRWSVGRPELKPADAKAPEVLASGTFSMWLRCEAPAGGTCRVTVDICAKPKPQPPKPLFPSSSGR